MLLARLSRRAFPFLIVYPSPDTLWMRSLTNMGVFMAFLAFSHTSVTIPDLLFTH